MKEILFNLYLNIIYYKVNILNKYCIIYTKKYLTKTDITYIIKNLFKNYFNNIKINIINKNKFLKKYYIYIK